MKSFSKSDLEAIVRNSLIKVIDVVPFIDRVTHLSITDRNYPIYLSMEYDYAGIVLYEDRVEFATEYVANDKYLVKKIMDVLASKPVLHNDKVFVVNNKYFQLVEVSGDEVTATLFATFDLEVGWDFYWEEGHLLKIEDLTVRDARRLELL